MKKQLLFASLLLMFPMSLSAQVDYSSLDEYCPVRSFYVSIPPEEYADEFLDFVENDMIPGGFNNLIIRINWSFPFKSHPELIDHGAWTFEKMNELVRLCKEAGVTIVPMINLFGHQSWEDKCSKLLSVYPQFDERPEVKLPAKGEYKWPNPDGYYCKSYCPRHPELHKILFECIDEILEAFQAKDFHCGMDEIFDIASDNCPRCHDVDRSEILADEINLINRHLNSRGVRMWMWADRLLDGREEATGYGEWSASNNGTYRAIDLVDRNIVMCDWHYRVAEQSAVIFALKGFSVITCGWMHPAITQRQLEDLYRYRIHSSNPSAKRYLGFMQTVWSGFPKFMEEYRSDAQEDSAANNYKFLKQQFPQYSQQLKGLPMPQKDGRMIKGI